MHAPVLSDKPLPNLNSLYHFIHCVCVCVFDNNKIKKEFGEVNTKEIFLVSNLMNFFP